jgi:hypothetical protein
MTQILKRVGLGKFKVFLFKKRAFSLRQGIGSKIPCKVTKFLIEKKQNKTKTDNRYEGNHSY